LDFDGKHKLAGDARQLRLQSEGDELGFELAFDAAVSGVVFGDGKSYFDAEREQFYALAVLPKGKVQGTVTIEGKKSTVSGWAYVDHAWQNYPAHKMADRLYSVRGFSDQDSVAFLAFKVPGGGLMATLILTEGEEIGLATHKLKMAEAGLTPDPEKSDYLVPATIAVKGAPDGPSVDGLIRLERFHEEYIPTDGEKALSHLQRAVEKNPHNYKAKLLFARNYGEIGIFENAREHTRDLLNDHPGDDTASQYIKLLVGFGESKDDVDFAL
jgi:tetratricopeptide (TPR) repeat protein